jgi:hypothetical protein
LSTERWARIVWDYHHVRHALRKADCIVVLGSHDTYQGLTAARYTKRLLTPHQFDGW